ncbi:prepilin peptidase [bacterium]|nr:prepilin peptidase [bacterium]NBX81946.1 prepilin peptidase [bacterium]
MLLQTHSLGLVWSSLFGLLWGSFFNVCIFRLPEEKSIVWNRSHCRSCSTPLKWFHNIPILSFILLRGKCAFCGHRISIQYPLIEAVTAALFAGTWLHYGWSLAWIFYTYFVSSLLVITVIDLRHMIIPDELSLTGILIGVLASFFVQHITWWESLLGAALGGGIFMAIAMGYEKFARQEGLGGGDIKLLAMIGAWLGYQSILVVIVISSALGSVVGLSLMLLRKKTLKTAIPFGPFLALGAIVYLFWGEWIGRFLLPAVD